MQQLERLIEQAHNLATGQLDSTEAEVARDLQICNACRYCEGFCAVFPAMTQRLEFGKTDIHYLANLCHNCGACLHACQYAPPHEFAVNVPQAMARVRQHSYITFAWPGALGRLYHHAGLSCALALAGGLALFLLLLQCLMPPAAASGNFYDYFPHNLLVALFAPVFGFAVLALAVGVSRFWHNISPASPDAAAMLDAGHAVATLKYLDGGHGQGCNNADDAYTLWRRRFHHFTFYGFLSCFAATVVATGYHYLLGLPAPYALNSLPVLLGSVGGIGLLIGPAGLLWLNLRRDPLQGDINQRPMDRAFILLLLLTSSSGLLLPLARHSSALGTLLAIHLGVVMALFLTLPYGKFAHGIYRSAALLKWAMEKRQRR